MSAEAAELKREHHEQVVADALDNFRHEVNIALRVVDAKVIPTLEQLKKLNDVTSYLYFVINES